MCWWWVIVMLWVCVRCVCVWIWCLRCSKVVFEMMCLWFCIKDMFKMWWICWWSFLILSKWWGWGIVKIFFIFEGDFLRWDWFLCMLESTVMLKDCWSCWMLWSDSRKVILVCVFMWLVVAIVLKLMCCGIVWLPWGLLLSCMVSWIRVCWWFSCAKVLFLCCFFFMRGCFWCWSKCWFVDVVWCVWIWRVCVVRLFFIWVMCCGWFPCFGFVLWIS